MAGTESTLKPIVIGSRDSELAMVQANYVKSLLEAHTDRKVIIESSSSGGDKVLDKTLAELASASPGIFTKELEMHLFAGKVDVVVHSLKDMPTAVPPGLCLAAITKVRAELVRKMGL